MSINCGLIGLPNIGKSSIFNLLTNSNIKVDNFPFCTINPNIGFCYYWDNRLFILNNIINTKKIFPISIKFIDIAGLIKGAYKGEGLGNLFLNNIQSTSLIIHILRCFENDNISHIYNNINPIRDLEIVNQELILKDLEICNKNLLNKNNINDYILLKKILINLENGLFINKLFLSKIEINNLKKYNFLTIKPMIYIANINNENFIFKSKLLNFCKKNKFIIFLLNINKFKKKNEQIINKLLQKIIKFLNLHFYFTVSIKEIKAWILPKNSNLLHAGSLIHSDFIKLFIKAEIIHYDDFIKYKNKEFLKKNGKLYIKGKNYLVMDGDIINFILNQKK